MCPDQQQNLQPFGSQAMLQPSEPQQPGLASNFNEHFQVRKTVAMSKNYSRITIKMIKNKKQLKK